MLLIITNHYGIHGSITILDPTAFTINQYIIQFITSFGKVGSNLFVLITGYFLINTKPSIKKVIPVLTRLYFYAILILIIFKFTGLANITKVDLMFTVFTIFYGNWFIKGYIIFSLVLPFINPFLQKIDKKTYEKLIILILIFFSLIPSIIDNSLSFSDLDYFISLYLIGGYISLHFKENYKNSKNLLYAFISISLMAVYIFGFDMIAVKLQSMKFLRYYLKFNDTYSFLPLICSIFLFLYFKNLNIKSNFINYISSSVLSIYLIHDNYLVRNLIWKDNITYFNSDFLVLHIIVKVIIIFVCSLIIDKVISFIINKPEKYINENLQKLLEKFEI